MKEGVVNRGPLHEIHLYVEAHVLQVLADGEDNVDVVHVSRPPRLEADSEPNPVSSPGPTRLVQKHFRNRGIIRIGRQTGMVIRWVH